MTKKKEPKVIQEPVEQEIIEACEPVVIDKQVIVEHIQQGLIRFESEIGQLYRQVAILEDQVKKLQHPEYKPWYTSFGSWFSLALVLVMFYLIYMVYMSAKGYNVQMPSWFLRTVEALVPK
jgi:hypothetical protein